jgi:hypothetical protein
MNYADTTTLNTVASHTSTIELIDILCLAQEQADIWDEYIREDMVSLSMSERTIAATAARVMYNDTYSSCSNTYSE